MPLKMKLFGVKYKVYESLGIVLVVCWIRLYMYILSLFIGKIAHTFYVILVKSIWLTWVYQQCIHYTVHTLTLLFGVQTLSFFPFCAIKHIIRSSEYIQISGNQFKSFFFSVGPCKLKVKTVRAFDVHTHMIYRFLRIFHTRYTHERKHTHYLAIIFDPTIVILQWKSNTLRTL